MVKLNRIYTRTGDMGTTGLGTGDRVDKFDLRVEAFGTVDEANAAIGLARLHTAGQPELDGILARIQNDLFDLGADLCTPDTGKPLGWEPLRMVEIQVKRLEAEIDSMNAKLKPLNSFILPGGSPAAAYLHLARTVSRRAERLMCALAARPGEVVGPESLKYINRLSDLLFVLSRIANGNGAGDILWVPGLTRGEPAQQD
jgi:cob(I)alamin adenosyltransferase